MADYPLPQIVSFVNVKEITGTHDCDGFVFLDSLLCLDMHGDKDVSRSYHRGSALWFLAILRQERGQCGGGQRQRWIGHLLGRLRRRGHNRAAFIVDHHGRVVAGSRRVSRRLWYRGGNARSDCACGRDNFFEGLRDLQAFFDFLGRGDRLNEAIHNKFLDLPGEQTHCVGQTIHKF